MMKAKAINVHNSDDPWDLHTAHSLSATRAAIKMKIYFRKPRRAMGIFIFYRRGPSLRERGDDAGQRIWIIPKKSSQNGNTTEQFERTIDGRSFREGSRGPPSLFFLFLLLFFLFFFVSPFPRCEWWWWRYSDGVRALFLYSHIDPSAGVYGIHVEREPMIKPDWIDAKGEKVATHSALHSFPFPFFLSPFFSCTPLFCLFTYKLTGLQTRNERV